MTSAVLQSARTSLQDPLELAGQPPNDRIQPRGDLEAVGASAGTTCSRIPRPQPQEGISAVPIMMLEIANYSVQLACDEANRRRRSTSLRAVAITAKLTASPAYLVLSIGMHASNGEDLRYHGQTDPWVD